MKLDEIAEGMQVERDRGEGSLLNFLCLGPLVPFSLRTTLLRH